MAHRNRPYGLLARFYDDMMGDAVVEMNRHAREKILAREWPRIGRVLELACGSGATAVDLARKGLAVEALDWSPAFVRATRARAAAAGAKLRVRRGDMRDFAVRAPVDLVLCEFSALNNLDRHADLPRVFRCAARALRPGGLFLFDVNAPMVPERQQPTYWFEHANFKAVMNATLEQEGRIVRLAIEWFVPMARPRGAFRHARETIVNVHWSERELRAALRKAGFDAVRRFDGVDVRPPMPGATRGTDLYFLAVRARTATRARR